MTNEIKKGDLVSFGRPNGEKTIGRVKRVNANSVSGVTTEGRLGRPVGIKFRAHKSLVRLVGAPEASSTAPVSKRSDAAILADLRDVTMKLDNPEMIYMDGERNPAAGRREERQLNTQRNRLVTELGREPVLGELYA